MSAKVNSSVILHRGRVFRLLRENVTLVNGVTADLDVVRHPGASAIVPLSAEGTVIMITQYRHAIGDFIWEIPAGTFDLQETPLECARRELSEETGFSADVWHKLGEITPVPGYSDERIHIFLATELLPTSQELDRDEMIDVHEIKLDKAIEMVYGGLIQDSKTISGLILATHWLDNKKGVTAQ